MLVKRRSILRVIVPNANENKATVVTMVHKIVRSSRRKRRATRSNTVDTRSRLMNRGTNYLASIKKTFGLLTVGARST